MQFRRYALIWFFFSAAQMTVSYSASSAELAPPTPPLWEGELPSIQSSGSGEKWHPGHYMKSQANDKQSSFDKIFDQPHVLGAMVQYNWRELEPSKGVYDFSRIEGDLAYLSARGKRLIIKFDDRDFGATSARQVVPDYLLNDPAYGGGAEPTKNGWAAAIWRKPVMDREILLLQALAKRFDSEPYVEMFTTQETAPGWSSNQPADFDADDYYAQIARMQAEIKPYWPNTLCLQGVNHANTAKSNLSQTEMMELIFTNAYKAGWGIMEPDILTSNPTLAQRTFMDKYINRMPHGTTASNLVLNPSKDNTPPQEAFDFGVNREKVNYFTWISSYMNDVVGTINANNGDINVTCPDNIASCKR